MKVKDMMLIAMMTALSSAMGVMPAIPLAGGLAPIVLQSMAPILAGGILGARRGALSMVVFVILVACSVPVLSGMRGGLGYLLGPTSGYIFSWIIVAFLVGIFVSRIRRLNVWSLALFSAVISMVVSYPLGAASMAVTSEMSYAAALGVNIWFIPGDVLKAVVASIVIVRVRKALYGAVPNQEKPLKHVS